MRSNDDSRGMANCGWCNGPRMPGHGAMCALKTCSLVLLLLGLLAFIGVMRTLGGGAWLGLDNNSLWHLTTLLFVLSVGCKVKLVLMKQKMLMTMMFEGGCDDCSDDRGGGCGESGCTGGPCQGDSCDSGEGGDGQCCKGLPDDQCCKKKE